MSPYPHPYPHLSTSPYPHQECPLIHIRFPDRRWTESRRSREVTVGRIGVGVAVRDRIIRRVGGPIAPPGIPVAHVAVAQAVVGGQGHRDGVADAARSVIDRDAGS